MLSYGKCFTPMTAKLHGFTLVEILVAIAALGILAAIGVVTLTGVREDSRKKKLEHDVVVVNNAIDAFLLAGGNAGQLTEGNVIAALKQRVAAEGPGDMVGPQGPFLDLTVITNATDFDWSAVFSTSPSPHFTVVNATAGVVFGHGLASAVGGVGEREDAARSEWVWAYSNVAPPELPEAFVPEAVDAGYAGTPGVAVTTLLCPVISPGPLSTNLWGFPLPVTIVNPNPQGSSRIYYKVNTGSYTLYDGTPFDVGPGTVLTAVAVSLDPSRYRNSDGCDGVTYQVIPFPLEVNITAPSSMTYAEAGGLMVNQNQQSPSTAVLNIQNIQQIPPPYLNSGNFNIRYTMDGSDPLTSETAVTGPAFQGYYSPIAISLGLPTWGTNASLQVRAVAVAGNDWFVTSPVADAAVTANRLTLAAPDVAPPDQLVSPSVEVTMTKPALGPVGMEIKYTTNNTVPAWGNGILYAGKFILSAFGANEERFVQAATFPGSTNNFMTNWFLPSEAVARAYTGAAGFGSSLPSGVLVSLAEVQNNVQFRGSMLITEEAAQSNITFFGNARIIGNLYVPGTPKVYKDHVAESQWDNQLWSPANDANFANYILGNQFDMNGNRVIPPTESASPRVVDLNGSVTPTNYRILIQDSAKIEGKIYRRATPPSLPTVSNPGTKSNSTSRQYDSWTLSPSNPGRYSSTVDPKVNSGVSLTTNASLTLLPGNYGTVIASNNGRLVLGDASNPDNVMYYSFESLSVNGGAGIEVVGKVVVTVKYNGSAIRVDNNGFFGNSAHPEWLQLNVYSTAAPSASTQHVLIASTGTFYGQINAPKGLVTFQEGATFNGSVTAYKLQMTGSAGVNINFSLSPISD